MGRLRRRNPLKLISALFGNFFGPCATQSSCVGMTGQQFELRHALKYLAKPRDGLYIQPPFRVHAMSPVLQHMLVSVYRLFPVVCLPARASGAAI